MFKQICTFLTKFVNLTPSNPQSLRYMSRIQRKHPPRQEPINPGMQRQLNALKDGPDDVDLQAFEDDELDADFMNLDMTHRQHLREMNTFKERQKNLIVRQKYFKEKFPNFLTWYDKQQIQHLYKSNKEEWTIEVLSEGFPALPETIKKIVRTNWTKKNSSKIMNHDNSVKKNWELLKSGQIELPPDLTKHLKKFTNRDNIYYNPDNVQNSEKKLQVPPVNGEFSEIIASYERIKNKSVQNEKLQLPEPETIEKVKEETYFVSKKGDRKHDTVTLEYLKSSIEKDVALGRNITEDDKIILQELKKENVIIEDSSGINTIIDLKDISKTAYLPANKTTVRDQKHLEYPEKIIIPKEKLKRGCTYKLNDCYYDTDGLFLYRVPGMEK